jgi:hypothetical protein
MIAVQDDVVATARHMQSRQALTLRKKLDAEPPAF